METIAEFIRFYGPDQLAGFYQVEGQAGTGALYTQVKLAGIEGYWRVGHSANNGPDFHQYCRTTWAPVPESRKDVRFQGTGGHYLVIFKEAKDPRGMFTVGELLNTDEAMTIIWDVTGWLPGRPGFLDTVDPARYNGLPFFFDSVESANEWHSPARCEITVFAGTQFTELLEKVYRDEMTGAQAAAELQTRCEAEYKDAGFA